MAEKPTLLKKGTRIGPWSLIKSIGSGGQGEVWQVRYAEERHAPPRAMKLCLANERKERCRFEQEVGLLQRLTHSNVVEVLDASLEWASFAGGPAVSYFVMPLARGSIDDARWADDTISLLSLFRDACAGVQYIHDQGVLHRDLKPENILVVEEPSRAAVSDLGIASEEGQQGSLTVAHEVLGTPHYRAPELASGKKATVRSDIYGLGRVLERVLTGLVPDALTPREIRPGTRRLSVELADQINAVIRKSVAYDPADRFSNVEELLASLPEVEIALAASVVEEDAVSAGRLRSGPTVDITGLNLPTPGEFLGRLDSLPYQGDPEVRWVPQDNVPFAFLRVASCTPGPALTPNETRKLIDGAALWYFSTSGTSASHAWGPRGAVVVEPPTESGLEAYETGCATIVSREAEILGLNGYVAGIDDKGVRLVSPTGIERTFGETLRRYLDFWAARVRRDPPLEVTAGLVGTADSSLQLPQSFFEKRSPRVYADYIAFTVVVEDPGVGVVDCLSPFYDYLWESYGVSRPVA
ncbi:MAG: serine/threonine-protein kinase [Myxococcota bacterium]